MSFILSVLTHPSSDIIKPSLMIEDRSSGDRLIIGNIPSGLQRKCNEMSMKTSRLTNIFLSGILNWESISGLPGLILTISDQGVKSLNIFHSGNKILQYLISCWRYFIFRFGLDLNANDIENEINKSKINFQPINIKSNINYGSNENNENDLSKLNKLIHYIFPFQLNPSKPTVKKIANITLPNSIINPKISTNWIITPESTRGKFLVNNAKKLGCEISHYKDLCNFKPVQLSNGLIITPDQVLEPTRHFNSILVLDIPSIDYLENTINFNWNDYKKNNLPYSIVFHFLDDSLIDPLSNQNYIDFINSFDSSTTHFISHKSYSPNSLTFGKTFNVSLKWKTLLPNFYPLPKWSTIPILKINNNNNNNNNNISNVFPLISGQSIILKSSTGTEIIESTIKGSELSQFTNENAKSMYNNEIKYEKLSNKISKDNFDLMIENNNLKQSLKKNVDLSKNLKDQVETLILGTGSALPSTIRNVLCNIIRIPFKDENGKTGFRSIVLDAGENSFGSLRRLYKPDEVNMILDELSIIYLSHLHADHHLGIIDFIKNWNRREIEKFGTENRFKKLFIITPWQYNLFMNELNRVDEFIDKRFISYISCDEFMLGFTPSSIEQIDIEKISLDNIDNIPINEIEYQKDENISKNLYKTLGLEKIVACTAFHCDYAYSVSLSFILDYSLKKINDKSNIFKISYSGDTRPKSAFSFIGENSDLLIHESTLEDEKLKDAVDKKHSTTSEAVQVGILMKAKKIILTHFSQRYKSFNCSESVYKRLKNPITKDDLITNGIYVPSPPSSPKSNKSSQSIFIDDPTLPLEVNSNIFSQRLTDEARDNASKIEILFAYDNMKVQYSELGMQRTVFEKDHDILENLFTEEQEDELYEEAGEVNSNNNNNNNNRKNKNNIEKSKKVKNKTLNENENNSNKKQKKSP